jgi:hypothetical protein
MKHPIDRVVHSCDDEGESVLFHTLTQACDGVVLYRDGQHRRLNLEAFEKVDGHCFDLRGYEEKPGVD